MGIGQENKDAVTVLRAATRTAHRHVESHALMRPLVTGSGLDRDSYWRLLQMFYRYYRALEDELLQHVPQAREPTPSSEYGYRPRPPLLQADLEDLGDSSMGSTSFPDPPLPPLRDLRQALGVLYVIEGATRGGRVIAPRLSRSLGAGPEWAGRFFSLDVDDANEMHWTAFCTFLRRTAPGADAAPEHHEAMIDAAQQTFETLYLHLNRHRVLT